MRPDGGLNVVGLEDGTICTLSLAHETDLGAAIVARVTTGFLDRESDLLKETLAVYLSFKRTQAEEGVVCYLDHRDSLADEWTTHTIELGVDDGDMNPVIPLYGLGTYRRRQWRFRFPDGAGLYLVRASERVRTLDT
jgi:hypothetical protein